MTTKLRAATIKHIEADLYDYLDTTKRIQVRRQELMNPSVEELVGGKSNLPSDPTGGIVSRLVADKRLQELERTAHAVERVYNACDDGRKELIRLKYWTKPQTRSWEGIAQKLNISRRQAFRWRDEIVQAVAEELGWR